MNYLAAEEAELITDFLADMGTYAEFDHHIKPGIPRVGWTMYSTDRDNLKRAIHETFEDDARATRMWEDLHHDDAGLGLDCAFFYFPHWQINQ